MAYFDKGGVSVRGIKTYFANCVIMLITYKLQLTHDAGDDGDQEKGNKQLVHRDVSVTTKTTVKKI